MQLAIQLYPHGSTNLSPNTINILLRDGTHDHYIVSAPMMAPSIEVEGELYSRTNEIAHVKIKDRFGKRIESYRVYCKDIP